MGRPCGFCDLDGTFRRWQAFIDWIDGMIERGVMPAIVREYAQIELDAYETRSGAFDAFVRKLIHAYSGEDRLKGIRLSDAEFVAKQVVDEHGSKVHVFTRELMAAAKKRRFHRSLISGSPIIVVRPFAIRYGINPDHCFGTEHGQENGYFSGSTKVTWYDQKSVAVQMLRQELDIDLSQSFAIGDSESDASMLACVGYPICFNPNKELIRIARREGWPVVEEKKDVILVYRLKPRRGFDSVTLRSILPKALRSEMSGRVGAFVI